MAAATTSTDARSHVGEVDSVGMSRATWLADVEQTVIEPPDRSWVAVWRRTMSG